MLFVIVNEHKKILEGKYEKTKIGNLSLYVVTAGFVLSCPDMLAQFIL